VLTGGLIIALYILEQRRTHTRHGLRGAVGSRCVGCFNVSRPSVQNLGDQLCAVLGVEIEAALGDTSALGDVLHRQAEAALLTQKV
jgi:hypothetical protein